MSDAADRGVRPPAAGARLIAGRYAVLGELGRGGMGVVWRAEDRVIGRQVAVKELHLADGLAADDRRRFRERLLREARTAARLSDPAIVTIHDVVTDDGLDHIVMELIEARTLTDVVQSDGPLDVRAATAVARQLLSALRAAHAAGVTHRDVKPGNVLLDRAGRVKLTDFGIAHAADDTRLTGTGMLVGTPSYMAPEQLDGRDAGPGSDLWALGATLYFAVEGRAPFERDTAVAVISAVLHAEIPPTRVGGVLGSVITGLLQRDPAVRLTGPQAAALLDAPTAGLPLEERATTPLHGDSTRHLPPAAPAPRRRWPWSVAGLVGGLLIGVAGTVAVSAIGQPRYPTLTYGSGGDVPEFSVSNGNCYLVAPAPGRSVDSGANRDCDDSHESQVFAELGTWSSNRVIDYPGVDLLRAYAAGSCRLYFEHGVSGADKAELQVSLLIPAEAAFQRDTRTPGASTPSYQQRAIYCVLSRADGGQLEGTRLRGDG